MAPALLGVSVAQVSLLIKAVRYDDENLKMPPKKKLAPEQVAALEEWVKGGAIWPGAQPVAAASSGQAYCGVGGMAA